MPEDKLLDCPIKLGNDINKKRSRAMTEREERRAMTEREERRAMTQTRK